MQDIHIGAYNGDAETVSRLLAGGALVNERDGRGGYTPLMWACFRAGAGHFVPVIRVLIANGADVEAATDGPGAMSCLMLAVQSGKDAAVGVLLTKGAAVNATVEGMTALMIAAGDGATSIAHLLLASGADPRIRCGRYTASDYADYHGHDSLASELFTASCTASNT